MSAIDEVPAWTGESAQIEAFVVAVVNQQESRVQQMLAKGFDVNCVDVNGDFPLLLACRRESMTITQALLDAGANVNQTNPKGSCPIVAASMQGKTELVKILIDKGASVNVETTSKDTPISLATWKDHTQTALLLLRTGAKTDHVDKFGDTLLLDAARNGNVEIVRELIEKKVNINHINLHGHSALTRAFLHGHDECSLLLMNHEANVNIGSHEGRNNLDVFLGAMNEQNPSDDSQFCQVLLMLLDKKVKFGTARNPSVLDTICQIFPATNPISPVAFKTMMMMMKADVHAKPQSLAHVFTMAVVQADIEMLNECSRRHVDFNQQVRDKPAIFYILTHLFLENQMEILEVMVDAGADVNAKDDKGSSLLHVCVKDENVEGVKFLLKHEVNIMAVDKSGHPALHYASLDPNHPCLSLLQTQSLNLNDVNVLMAAQQGNHAFFQMVVTQSKFSQPETKTPSPPSASSSTSSTSSSAASSSSSSSSPSLSSLCHIVDQNGLSILMLAARGGHTELVKLLVKEGVPLLMKDKAGVSALQHAIRARKTETAEFLAGVIEERAHKFEENANPLHSKQYGAHTALLLQLGMKLQDTIKTFQPKP